MIAHVESAFDGRAMSGERAFLAMSALLFVASAGTVVLAIDVRRHVPGG
jgi:hypothetical protein